MVNPGTNSKHEKTFVRNSLGEFLADQHYQLVSLNKIATGHLVVEAFINEIPGAFIVDSGAGATVVDKKNIELFRLNAVVDGDTGAGAGGTGLTVYSSLDNKLSINEFNISSFKIAAMNLEHVNAGLKEFGVEETIHGIIGADLLEQADAVIDYAGKCLYLKMKQEDFFTRRFPKL